MSFIFSGTTAVFQIAVRLYVNAGARKEALDKTRWRDNDRIKDGGL